MQPSSACELSIVMPCLNEAETLAVCINKARAGIDAAGVTGEIIIADNGSTDGSVEIAERLGARVVHVREKGYGCALRGGIEAAAGGWIIMGDADDSYDFSKIEGFVKALREGYELVMGCRLPSGGGTILPGAMPWKNRWIGNPCLSNIGRLFFRTKIRDFHCGMRGFNKTSYLAMDLQTTGMEFASEMVTRASLDKLRITEVPITLHADGRTRPPHLKPWRDGWRHLRFMLIYSPRWLFLVPGLLLSVAGFAVATLLLIMGQQRVTSVEFSTGTLTVACMSVIAGVQIIAFGLFTKVFAIAEGLLPDDPKFSRIFRYFTLEKGIVAGFFVFLVGLSSLAYAVWIWKQAHFGRISYPENLSRVIPSITGIVLGLQITFSSFFLSVLGLKTVSRTPPTP
jgi:glycosyltransferase involved in cell wall biosynthesis